MKTIKHQHGAHKVRSVEISERELDREMRDAVRSPLTSFQSEMRQAMERNLPHLLPGEKIGRATAIWNGVII